MSGSKRRVTPTSDSNTDGLAGDFSDLMRAIKNLIDPYRPELHYMRGPGPRWHAKHERSETVDAGAMPVLARVKG
jgi:hypothetical protein